MKWFRASVFSALLVLALLATQLASLHQRELLEPFALDAETVIHVRPGQNLRQMTAEWKAMGWVRYPWLVEAHARYYGLAHRLMAGEYRVQPGSSMADLLGMLNRGRVVQHRVTIIEGWRIEQLIQALNSHEVLHPLPPDVALEDLLRLAGGEGGHPEGWFLPDTYHFSRGASAMEILRKAHEAMLRELNSAWESIDPTHPVDHPYELLTLASIIERETGAVDERGLVAGVFVNRLKQGMRLQTDPTLLYAMGPDARRLNRAELRRDHEYNTYTRHGLPPTPIALPGRASLRAAARPDATDALFFVSRNDGTHQFSATYAEHREAVIRYQLAGDASRYGGGGR